VIDASVAAKWYLRDEELLVEADRFQQQAAAGILPISAPHVSRHEVANTLATAIRSGRTTEELARVSLSAYVALPVSLEADPEWLLQRARQFAVRFSIAIYDATYLALGEAAGAAVVTADRKLCDLVRDDLSFVRWLGDVEL
jgi:predicted nucleic acid-binding protein